LLIRRLNAFVTLLLPMGVNRKLTAGEKAAYRGPFPTPQSRVPTAVFPHEILASRLFLRQVETGLDALADKPVLITWGDADVAFRDTELRRFESTFPNHRTVILRGAKHFIQENSPLEISRAIVDFEHYLR
jgi:haloalkane dehalogenase